MRGRLPGVRGTSGTPGDLGSAASSFPVPPFSSWSSGPNALCFLEKITYPRPEEGKEGAAWQTAKGQHVMPGRKNNARQASYRILWRPIRLLVNAWQMRAVGL